MTRLQVRKCTWTHSKPAMLASPPRTRRRGLASLRNVRTALADALWGLEADLMEPAKARVLIYGYSVLAGIIQGTDLEERIESLETAIKDDPPKMPPIDAPGRPMLWVRAAKVASALPVSSALSHLSIPKPEKRAEGFSLA